MQCENPVETNTIVSQWICRNKEFPTPALVSALSFEAAQGI